MEVVVSFELRSLHHDPRGSMWHRWDLHYHTPASYDYHDKSVTNQQIVDHLIAEGIRVVAITDHHHMDVPRIKELQRLSGDQLTVLPGIELRDDHGGDPIHYICIFPEDCDLDHIWTTLQGHFKLTRKGIEDHGGNDKVYVPLNDCAPIVRDDLGGLISIHAGNKTNSIDSIKNTEQFQQRIKYDLTSKWVDFMEIGQLKDIHVHLTKIFPSTGLNKPLIICSDCHSIHEYKDRIKAPLWLRADPNFRGLKMVLREPSTRVHIGTVPTGKSRVEQNPTKYVRKVTFHKRDGLPSNEKWFDGEVQFNTGLVAIIGNKGSGKSALADTIGLLGATKNAKAFSFLNDERFLHPTRGRGDLFEATLEWNTGPVVRRNLGNAPKPEEVERVKYLPQTYVETVCNELVDGEEGGFEQELKSVIFSHVPEPQRLGQTTLDDLVRFQTSEKQNRIDSLIRNLRDLSRNRALLEEQANPQAKQELEERLKQRRAELAIHEDLKPEEVADPATLSETSPEDLALLTKLSNLENDKNATATEIRNATEILRSAQVRQAVADRLSEKLENFEKDFATFMKSLTDDATALGLEPKDLVSLKIDFNPVRQQQDLAAFQVQTENQRLEGFQPPKDESPGLRVRLKQIESEITDLQARLDAPNRAYQAYLKELADWEAKRKSIEGHPGDPESVRGIETALAEYDRLPEKIGALRALQLRLAMEIHQEKLEQSAIYRKLYGSVQEFIDTHELAKNKLRLEFRAELADDNFVDKFLEFLSQNRRGSFMGVDEGRARAQQIIQQTTWEDAVSVEKFLDRIEHALRNDEREKPPVPTSLRDQLVRSRRPEDVYNMLYGLEFVQPKYILRWEGKDLSLLSPGERGTLLLVFYLLIDQSDIPLIIDQPEGNLDNHTVTKVLVECIKAARDRRQVFIVTHNPNLAVVCDADQVIHASMDLADGNAVTYTSGALENPQINQCVTDVLEGTRPAFDLRGKKYDVVG
jgi:ABC-type lipoprotein export system ATPase subunit